METTNQRLNALFEEWKKARNYSDNVFVSMGLCIKMRHGRWKKKKTLQGLKQI